MEQKILVANNVYSLNRKIQEALENSWIPVGSHCVCTVHIQNSFRGANLINSTYTNEYSQTIQKQ